MLSETIHHCGIIFAETNDEYNCTQASECVEITVMMRIRAES